MKTEREPLVKDWELYSASMRCDVAKRALDGAMARAAKKLVATIKRRDLHSGDSEGIGRLIARLRDEILVPTMHSYSRYGASDSEPYFQAGQGLINAAKDYFGIPRTERREDWGDYL